MCICPQVQKEVLEKRRLEKKTTMDSLKKYKKGQHIFIIKDLEDLMCLVKVGCSNVLGVIRSVLSLLCVKAMYTLTALCVVLFCWGGGMRDCCVSTFMCFPNPLVKLKAGLV